MTLEGYADPFTGNTSVNAMVQACPTVGAAPAPTGTIKFFEGTAQRAFAAFLHVLEHQLVLAARFVQGQATTHEHLQAVARREAQARGLHAEHRAAHLRVLVLQREVDVARSRAREVADFALDPDLGKGPFQHFPRERVQLGRGDYPSFTLDRFCHAGILTGAPGRPC
jgi:hypothetical protein